MRASRLTTAAIAIAAAGLVLAGCGGSSSSSAKSSTTTEASSSATSAAAGGAPLNVVTKDFMFVPTTLTAKVGQPVTVTIKNEGQAEHNFSITSLKVNTDVQKATTQTVTFTPTAAGDVQFFCEYHHTSYGMVGTLTVTS